jgi:DNA-binding beta-propeller fold protein YncE
VTSDEKQVVVVNADLDSVSILDTGRAALTKEVLLGSGHPKATSDGTYTPQIQPRSLVLSSDDKTAFVSGERSGKVYAIDLGRGVVTGSVSVGSEPLGVALSSDGKYLFVASSQDGKVVKVDADKMTVSGSLAVTAKPWNLAWSGDGDDLLVSHLLSANVTAIDPTSMKSEKVWTLPEVKPRGDKRLAHGVPRGLFDLAARPGSSEVWVLNTLLGIDTAQPDLDFESTAFPAVSIFQDGQSQQTLSTDAQDVPGTDGAFPDVVSGVHAIAFTSDGAYALIAGQATADILVVDASQRIEATLLRPLPGKMVEGIVIAPNDKVAYVDQRNTNDVAIVHLDTSGGTIALTAEDKTIKRSSSDPMSAELRLGQHLFHSADSGEYAITKNHWISCATCHMEGRSDAVTWKFAQGPRDTPSNAGGTDGTGFLFRTADRNKVQDYWKTINVEQGGNFDPTDPTQAKLLDAIATYVNHGIPLPIPPTTDPKLVAKGKAIFERKDVGCATCHSGPRFTDSGEGNKKLDLAGFINLHDVGTCVKTRYPDVAHQDIDGDKRAACRFDTPSLNGVADSAPYLHDGSAATLRDVLEMTKGKMGNISSLSSDDLDALVEYLRSL